MWSFLSKPDQDLKSEIINAEQRTHTSEAARPEREAAASSSLIRGRSRAGKGVKSLKY